MKRWAIAKMGEWEGPGEGVGPKLQLYPCNRMTWSVPGFNWGFCKFAAANIDAIEEDPDIYVLPDGAMDMSVGSIPSGIRTTMRTKLEAAGFTFSDVKTTWTVRQLLLYLVKQIQPNVQSVESADVIDVEQ